MSQSDDPGAGSTPYGSTPSGSRPSWPQPYGTQPSGPQPSGTQPWGSTPQGQATGGDQRDQPSYGEPAYGQHPYGESPYGQPAYGQSPYPQPSYGQPPYSAQYGQPTYGAPAGYGQYGWSAAPPRPGPVVVAAILGFVFGTFGILATLGVFLGGAAVVGMAGALDAGDDPLAGLGGDAATGVGLAIVAVGLVFLAWTVLMIWGSVWALTGRSRVLLLVGGSVAAVVTFIGVVTAAFDTTTDYGTASEYAFGIVLSLVFFLAALAIVVPLCLRPATQFFAAHRARRGR
jgi:hypothetical protein